MLIKIGKARFAWTTLLPLAWLCAVTFTAGREKVFAASPKLGFLAHARMIQARFGAVELPPPGAKTIADARQMLFNDRLDAVVSLTFMAVAVVVSVVSCASGWWYCGTATPPYCARHRPWRSAMGVAVY